MSAVPEQAMVLAAGLGTRMRPLSDKRPKPLVEVGGRTLIDRVLDRLIEAGIKRVVINVHYQADMLEAHLAKRHDIAICISDERGLLLDTGGGVAKALHHFGDAPFITHNADSLWSEGMGRALERLSRAFDPERMDALMLLAPTVSSIGYVGRGDFTMDETGHLSRREEGRIAPFVWAGVQILHPRLFEGCPKGAFSTNLLWDRAIAKGRLYGIRHGGVWMHVGSPEDVQAAEHFLNGH